MTSTAQPSGKDGEASAEAAPDIHATGFAAALARWLVAHRRRVLSVALIVTALAAWLVPQLRFETDLVALLPEDSPAAADYRLFLQQFGGFEKVFVVVLPGTVGGDASVEDADPGLLIAAAERLSERLQDSPEVAAVRSGLEPDDEQFLLTQVVSRAPLFLDRNREHELAARLDPAAVARRAQEIRALLASPVAGWQVPFLIHDPLGLSDPLQLTRRAGDGLPIDPMTSSFLSQDEGAALVILTPAGAEIDPESGRRLQAALDGAFEEVGSELGGGVRFVAVGGPLYAAQDEAILRQDLQSTVGGSVIGCIILLLLAFGGPRQPLIIFTALGVALCWSLGLVVLVFGALSAAGIGFAAVLVGLGVDYGIHGGTRFRQQRLAGQSAGSALAETLRHSGPGIATSALTTAVAFAVLGLAHFRPLRELGAMVALGILAILIAATFVGGALAVQWRGRGAAAATARGSWLWRCLGVVVDVCGRQARLFPRTVLIIAVLATLAALPGLRHLDISADLRALRPADHPALEAEQLLVEHFGVGLDTATVVLSAPDLASLLQRNGAVADVLRQRLPDATVTSAGDWLLAPSQVEARLLELNQLPWKEASETLERALGQAGLSAAAFAPGLRALEAFGQGRDPAPVERDAWPSVAQELLRRPTAPEGVVSEGTVSGGTVSEGTVSEGTVSEGVYWAALRLRLPKGAWPDGPPQALQDELESLAPGVAIASAVALGQDMRRLATDDLRRLGLIALALMLLMVGLSFRGRLRPSVLALVPVVLGCWWTFGLWGALGLPLDLLSLAVLPILLGIGIDDGLHAMHGAQSAGDSPHPVVTSVGEAGRAMVLTTLTTAVGFASLTLSSVPGLRRGGALISFGVFACLAATLWVLPAWDVWTGRRRGSGR